MGMEYPRLEPKVMASLLQFLLLHCLIAFPWLSPERHLVEEPLIVDSEGRMYARKSLCFYDFSEFMH